MVSSLINRSTRRTHEKASRCRADGAKYSRGMAGALFTSNGSLDRLKVSWGCRGKPMAHHMRESGVCVSPVFWAIVHTLQCVAAAGWLSSYQREAPRLCRGGNRSLTFQEVVRRSDLAPGIRTP